MIVRGALELQSKLAGCRMSKDKKSYILLAILALPYVTSSYLNSKSYAEINTMDTGSRAANSFSVLTANVGNLSIGCMDVLNKLCYKDVEERITKSIELLNPEVVALQEVLPPWQCENIKATTNRNKVCYEKQLVPQVRRLLGNEYTIACNDRNRNQFECIAVKTSVGSIIGCEQGQLCNSARTGIEVDGCDNGFTVSAATVKLRSGFTFDLVNLHPQSTDDKCRARMISLAFEGNGKNKPLIQQDNVLLMGDFNFDPWRDQDKSTETWKSFFAKGWGGRDFIYHSGIVEKDPPYYTSFLFYRKRTPDMIVSNFAQGVCKVLGESPDTSRLDGGKGTDHRALFGLLTVEP
jgi:Endonuclease/Exonuclease/phosphatase family